MEVSRNQEIGEIDQKSGDLGVITWKISNVSSIALAIDYGVQSPTFSFADASWILKVYFYGQKKFHSLRYIDVVIERLHSEIEMHDSVVKIYLKGILDKEYKPVRKVFSFSANQTAMNVVKIMSNFQEKIDKWKIVPNDTFTLVCEIESKKSLFNEKTLINEKTLVNRKSRIKRKSSVKKKSEGQASGKSENSGHPEVGEIYINSYQIETIKWTIPNVSFLPSPADCQVQSPQFSFASASWTLKMYPYFQLEYESKQYFYVALTRLHSQISEYSVSVSISFEDHIKNTFNEVSRSHIFHTNKSHGHAISFTVREEQIIPPHDTFTLLCKFRTEKGAVGDDIFKTGLTLDIHKNRVLQDLKELFLKQEDCDVIIRVKGQEFPAHRAILKARCPVFDSAFRNDMKEKATGVMDIEDCNPTAFSDFLCFLYCGDTENLTVENVFNLFAIADKYETLDLRSRCLQFIKDNLTIDTFCDTIVLALQHSENELLKFSIDFFAKNLKKIIVTVQWQSFISENPIQGDDCKSRSSLDLRTNKVLQDLKALFLQQEDCDVIIKVEGQEFPAYRAILKARSPVFDSTLRHDMKEKATGVIDIEDCDPITFSDFLCFLYCGDLENLSVENVFSLFTTADKYEVLDLRSKCMEFIKKNLSIDTFCETISLALKYSESGLIQLCTYFFAKNLEKIIVTVKWQSFLAQNPTESNELLVKALVADKNPNK